MNSNEIFDEYTKASYKTKWIRDKGKELDVPTSEIIFELLKSGYKFDELKRGAPGPYKSAVKKYEKWKKAGSPSDEDVDVMERFKKEAEELVEESAEVPAEETAQPVKEPEQESTQVEESAEKPIFIVPAEELVENPVEETVQPIEQPMKEETQETLSAEQAVTQLMLISETQSEQIAELKHKVKQAERALIEKAQEFQETVRVFKDRISRLEKENRELTQNYNESMQMNAAVEKQNADGEQYRAKYYELLEEHEKLKKLHEIDACDLESERENLTIMFEEIKEKEHRLELAERFILNSIYEKLENPKIVRKGDKNA